MNLSDIRPHQYMTVLKGMHKAEMWKERHPNPQRDNPCVLAIGALPRSGKSYMGAATVHMYAQKLQADGILSSSGSGTSISSSGRGPRALVYTTQPTETGSTWCKVFSQHAEFDTAASAAPMGSAAAAAAGEAHPSACAPAASGENLKPVSWVVMSKQAYDSNKAHARRKPGKPGTRKAAKAAAAAAAAAAAEESLDAEEAPADDEYDEPDSAAESDLAATPEDARTANSLLRGVKVIGSDAATAVQWRQQYGPEGRPTMADVVGPGFDIILFDEAHLGSTSDLSRAAVEQLMAGPHTLLVLITATYIRPIGGYPGYSVPRDHLLTWSLLDVGNARTGNLKALAEVHGQQHMEKALKLSCIAASNQVRQITRGISLVLTASAQPVHSIPRVLE
jgi:hypothetical protein